MRSNYIVMLYKDAVKTWKKWVYLEWLQRTKCYEKKVK
jgi:hypothetical protein